MTSRQLGGTVVEINRTITDLDVMLSAADMVVAPEVDVVYWSFEMQQGGVFGTYYMATMFGLSDVDKTFWVGFYDSEDALLESISRASVSWGASLMLPWRMFAYVSRRVLRGRVGTEVAFKDKSGPDGTLAKVSGAAVKYTTECGVEYFFGTDTLKALLA